LASIRTRLKLHSRTGKRHERGDRSVIARPLLNKPRHRLQDGARFGAAVCGLCGGKFPDFIDHLRIKPLFTRALNFPRPACEDRDRTGGISFPKLLKARRRAPVDRRSSESPSLPLSLYLPFLLFLSGIASRLLSARR
jgi:hypothetical protein